MPTRAARSPSASPYSLSSVQRPVGPDDLHRDHLGGEVAEARAGPVGSGRDRAGERLAVDVAEVLERHPVLVQAPVQVAEHDPRLDLDGPRHRVDVEQAVEQLDPEHGPVGQGRGRERVPRARDLDPAAGRDRVDDRPDQALTGVRAGDLGGAASLLARPVAPARIRGLVGHGSSVPSAIALNPGGVAERLNALVLKTSNRRPRFVGSNPTPSVPLARYWGDVSGERRPRAGSLRGVPDRRPGSDRPDRAPAHRPAADNL